MTGPEHYAEAERLMAISITFDENQQAKLERAQVHATLAHAAAVIEAAYQLTPGDATRHDVTRAWWRMTMGVAE